MKPFRYQVCDQVSVQVIDQISVQVCDQVSVQVLIRVRDQVWDQVGWMQVRNQVKEQV